MPSPFPNLAPYQRGHVRVLDMVSRALAGNPWGDPVHRDVHIYTPPGYERDKSRRYPVVLLLPAYASTGEAMLARGLSEVSMASRIDALIEAGCPPFLAVMPEVMTRLGGSQFVDSSGIGAYASFLVHELRPFLDRRFRTTGVWGLAGRSSGGFGALHLAMEAPGIFSAVVSHAGDMGFDLAYWAELPAALGALREAGGPMAFVRAFWAKERTGASDFAALSLLCLCAAYGSEGYVGPDGFPGPLPFDLETGAIDFAVYQSWRRFDPVVRLAEDPAAAEALGRLRLLFLDAGDRDEHHLHLGARRFAAGLRRAGVAHQHEEFKGGHRGTAFRWDRSLPLLAAALHGA
jgi:S-formylglutathione hydrolase FrmB